jgi:hypothetical protein
VKERVGGWEGQPRGQKRKSGHGYPLFRWGAMPRSRRPVKIYSIGIQVPRARVQAHSRLISPSTPPKLHEAVTVIWGSRSAHDSSPGTNEKLVIVSRWHSPVRAPNQTTQPDSRWAADGGMQSFSRFRFHVSQGGG